VTRSRGFEVKNRYYAECPETGCDFQARAMFGDVCGRWLQDHLHKKHGVDISPQTAMEMVKPISMTNHTAEEERIAREMHGIGMAERHVREETRTRNATFDEEPECNKAAWYAIARWHLDEVEEAKNGKAVTSHGSPNLGK
jgi:hypothetical protein